VENEFYCYTCACVESRDEEEEEEVDYLTLCLSEKKILHNENGLFFIHQLVHRLHVLNSYHFVHHHHQFDHIDYDSYQSIDHDDLHHFHLH
jgi:hypothetical protein